VNKSRELARLKGVALRAECADLNHWHWQKDVFDVVVSIYLHFAPEIRPVLHRAMFDALKPGGVLIMEAFNKSQLQYKSGGPQVEAMLYSAEMLRGDFACADIELLEETITELEEGKYHVGPGAVVRLVLHKPAA
jgi:trans-aconitate methyltransferase